MKKFLRLRAHLFLFVLLFSISSLAKAQFTVSEVSPWCIIGFDSLDRTPTQRIAMLKEMGFTKYGYNRGKGEFDSMQEEFKLAKENNIEITSVFLWLNAKRDSLGKLDTSNEQLLSNLKKTGHKPTIWVSFSNNYFEGLSQEESVALSVKMIRFVKERADALGCKLALYNHRGWFGNPLHQIDILEQLKDKSVTMVFNFHHARETVKGFAKIAKKITPYLSHVNLSGVNTEGPEIVSLGQGSYEIKLVKKLLKNGYEGPWGILGHVKTEDVQVVLNRNIKGLNLLNSKLKQKRHR
jgi:sugar phosphate isomerase/epimerase